MTIMRTTSPPSLTLPLKGGGDALLQAAAPPFA